MKLKYYIPTSLHPTLIKIVCYTMLMGFLMLLTIPTVEANWMNTSFNRSAPLHIYNGNNSNLSYYSTEFNISYQSTMNANFSDIRVYNLTTGALTPLHFKKKVDSSYVLIRFNVTYLPALSWVNDSYGLYWGNTTTANVSNGNATYLFYDDFEDQTTAGWTTISGTWSASNRYLTETGHAAAWEGISYPYASDEATFEADISAQGDTGQSFVSDKQGNTHAMDGYAVSLQAGSATGQIAEYPAGTTILSFPKASDASWNSYIVKKNASGGMNVFVNYSNVGNVTDNTVTGSLYMSVWSFAAAGVSSLYDNLTVRKYSQVEPTVIMGSVSSLPTFIPIVQSDSNVKYSNISTASTTSATPILLKDITITENYTGSWRIIYDLTSSSAINHAYSQIYINNVSYGSIQSALCCTTTEANETFTDIHITYGDVLQVYGYREAAVSSTTSVSNFKILFNYDYANATVTPTYPINNSVVTFSFPPQFTDINFTWSQVSSSGYEIMLGKDINFNILVSDTTTSNPYIVQSLDNATYYWKVRTYNDGGATLGAWSDTFNFNLAQVSTGITGTVLNGIVYEIINGASVPIAGATVYASNVTNTYQFYTGSNGYYQFNNLTNTTTYSVYAIKQGYDNSQTLLIVPTTGAVTTLNIPLRIYISPYVPNFVFEKLVIRTLYDEPYPGITVNVYKGSSLSASFTGTTDYNGVVVFQLIKDQYYRMTLSGGSLTSTLTFYFYAKEETQRITIATGFPTGGNKYADINATLYVSSFNTTYSNVSLYYNDVSLTTSEVNFYAKNLTTGIYPCANQTSATYPVTFNCTVEMNGSYQFGYNATSSKYGFIQQDKIVNFNASNTSHPQTLGNKVDSEMLNWISILLLIFVAGLFSTRSVKFGAVIVPLFATILYWFGVFDVNGVIVHTALVLGVMTYIRMSENKTQY